MARARRSSPTVLTFAVLGLLLLCWQSLVAGRNGLSDVYARPAINYLQERAASDVRISEAEWQAVFDSISRANELMPGNPRYLDNLGQLEQIKVGSLADARDIDQVAVHARAAEDYSRDALAVRPTWPHFWGDLALEKYRRGESGTDEYSIALANAARFGPWNKVTQRLVADLGSKSLEFLSPSAQREFLLNLERALHSQPAAMFDIVANWESVCEKANVPDITLPLLSSHCERDGDQLLP